MQAQDTHRPADLADAPFLADVARRVALEGTSFHMPGHKNGAAAAGRLLGHVWGEGVLRADLSEMGGLDYLHAPAGALLDAQRRAAALFGADETFFLVNGSTAGNQAALFAALSPGQKVLLPRASHRSVYAALVLTGAIPVYVPATAHPDLGVPVAVDAALAAEAATAHPDLAAVHVTSPSYYGVASDLRAFAATAARAGAPLVVDEAHGTHFAFHPAMPEPALRGGADVAVQSAHKTLGSLTQSSFLHAAGDRLDRRRLRDALSMLQSSSPSALLTASLDAVRAVMAAEGPSLLARAVELAQEAREEIRRLPGLWCRGTEVLGKGGAAALDPTKLLVDVSALGITGYAAERRLAAGWGVETELSDSRHVLFSLTLADTPESVSRLLDALRALAGSDTAGGDAVPGRNGAPAAAPRALPGIPRLALSLREGYYAASRAVSLREAAGSVCAESVIPYPPGIPALLPGEVVDAETVEYLAGLAADGATFVGVEDVSLATLRVLP